MPRIPSSALIPVIDTREQTPLDLPGAVRGTLNCGDYSLLGLERWIALERKSAADLFSTLAAGRERFTKELERLQAVPFRCLVIECSLSDILHRPPEHSAMHPLSVLGSLGAFSWRFGLPVWFCDNPRDCATLVYRLLHLAHKEIAEPQPWRLQRKEAARARRAERQQQVAAKA